MGISFRPRPTSLTYTSPDCDQKLTRALPKICCILCAAQASWSARTNRRQRATSRPRALVCLLTRPSSNAGCYKINRRIADPGWIVLQNAWNLQQSGYFPGGRAIIVVMPAECPPAGRQPARWDKMRVARSRAPTEGRIHNARPLVVEIFLLRTAGPYIRIKMRRARVQHTFIRVTLKHPARHLGSERW